METLDDNAKRITGQVRTLLGPASPWRVEVVERAGSTNAELAARVRQGGPLDHVAMVALDQEAGKGRLARSWSMPPGQGVAVSMALPLTPDITRWGLIPLGTGVAVVRAAHELGIDARLKWPNDVLVGGRKLCGILAEVAGSTVVVGVGVNVSQTAETIFPGGISVGLAGSTAGRAEVVAAVLNQVDQIWTMLGSDAGRAALLGAYRASCDTLQRQVRVYSDEQTWVEGEALDIADDGELLVRVDGEVRAFASGDVYHLR